MRHIGGEDELERDAASDPLRQLQAPAGFLRDKIEHSLGARRFVEEGPPIGDRILLCRRRQFVDKAFDHEDIVRWPHAAPERCGNARGFHPHILDVHVGKGIGEIDRALGGIGIETIVEPAWQVSRDDRRAREAIVPGDRYPFLIETGGHPIEEGGPVHVVLDIFLARPHDFDRAVDMFGDLNRTRDAVGFESTAEPATDQMVMDHDLV